MSKVLYIKANPKSDGSSRTFKISDAFIDNYKKENPQDQVITLDLYKEDIDFLHQDDIAAIFNPKDGNSSSHPVLKYAYQFKDADKYIISAPMWNLSIPAILKAYIDYVSISGITFQYTQEGAVGLCNGKKAINIVTRGGEYSEGPFAAYEMGDKYLRTIFGFFGITDFTTLSADKLDVQGIDVNSIMNNAITDAKEKVTTF